jgi:hypothetical protein
VSAPNGSSSHGADCGCVRCRGFEQGNELGRQFKPDNDLSTRHGALASAKRLANDPETIALADGIRASMPSYAASDEVTIELLAITMRRVERATAAVDVADGMIGERPLAAYNVKGPELKALRDDLRGWIRLCASLADSLGMSPLARSRLGLNVVRARGEALRAHLLENYDGNGEP